MSIEHTGTGADHKGTDLARRATPEEKAGFTQEIKLEEQSGRTLEDVDEALKFLYENNAVEHAPVTPEEERRVLWKLDLHVLPLLCILYCLQFLDKTSLGYTAVMGIEEDLHLKGDNYQWLGSAFYIGYLVAEFPAAWCLQRFRISKSLGTALMLWGCILTLHAASFNFAGIMTLRLVLGIMESSVTPGFMLITSAFYRKHEQASRVSFWFCFNGMAQIIGAVVTYAILVGSNNNHFTAVPAYKFVFIYSGGLTIIFGLLFFLFFPDSPATAKFLNTREKIVAIERLRENNQGLKNKHFKRYQFNEAFKDPLTWMYVLASLVSDIPNGLITNFTSLILVGMGLSDEESLLYGAPTGAVQIVSTIFFGIFADKLRSRNLSAIISMVPTLVGYGLMYRFVDGNQGAQLAGLYLTGTSACMWTIMLSQISTNTAGYTKKGTVSALNLISYCVGNLIGPHLARNSEAPYYTTAKQVTVILLCIECGIQMCIWVYCWQMNKKKAKIVSDPNYRRLDNQEFLDLTDRENPEFVYVL